MDDARLAAGESDGRDGSAPGTRIAEASRCAPSTRAAAIAAALLLVGITVAAYVPALGAGFVWDDDLYLTANPALRSADGLRSIWLEPGTVPQYYPLTFTSFSIEYQLWGLEPFGYHLVNILLHACTAVLVWRVLRRLGLPAAWMAAAVFALHPIQVESVAWITERKNVLSAPLALAALLAYLRPSVPATGGRYGRSDLLVWVLFLGALLSKTATCTLPAVMLVLAWWQGRAVRCEAWRLAPLFVLALGMAAMTVWMERQHIGAAGQEWTLSVAERALIAGRALWFYPRTLLWPRALAFVYPQWSVDPHAWWQYLFPAAAAGVVIALYAWRRRIGRGPLVAALCYGVVLAPTLGFFDLYFMRYAFVADHFAYLPSIALIALAVATTAVLVRPLEGARRYVARAAGAAALMLLAALTAGECVKFRDLRTLWTDTLANNPECWLAHNNLGTVLAAHGELEPAVTHYRQALRWNPEYIEARINLGNALEAQGKLEEAIVQYREALRRSASARVHIDLGNALAAQGHTDDAVAQYRAALRLQPESARAHNNLALALVRLGESEAAAEHYAEALRLQPDYALARNNFGLLLAAHGRLPEAIAQYRAVLRRHPADADARRYLASALAAQRRARDPAAPPRAP